MINNRYNNYPFLAYYLNNFNQNHNFNYFGVMVTWLTTFFFEVQHPRCVSNHSVENEYEKTVMNTTILYLYS
jgi:hypothetical protein